MAEAVALARLGWVVSPVVKDLVTKSKSDLGTDIAKGLEDLETTLLPQFELTIQAAQQSPDKARLVRWLARMKNAYYDAEGILHELEYERLKRKAKGENKKLLVRLSSKPMIKPLAKFTGSVIKKASLLSPQKRKLLKRLEEFKKVAAEAETFRNLLSIQNTESKQKVDNKPFLTTSVLGNTDKVFGRDGDRDEIINFLFDEQGGSSSTKNYSTVAIAGMGGAGKTTLAKYVYNDPKVQKHFDVRIWLCLSQNMDITELTKVMIERVSGKHPELCNLNNLQEKLIEILPNNIKLMIVLDNVWYDNNDGVEDKQQWEDLLKPFDSRRGTCKIVVTSRSSRSFPIELQLDKIIKLSDLAPNDFKSLLRCHAIDGLQISNPQMQNYLSDMSHIVDLVAEKMSKLPLAAKVVDNQLRSRPEILFWRDTLEKVNLSDIMDILLWSFHRFDVQLQRCFLFCSIFPKGKRYDDDLIAYWVALDFISVEKIGLEYIEILVANSVLRVVDETRKEYIMHDLFHDLAEKLSTEDCFRVTNVDIEIPSTVQHVYLQVNNENLSSIRHLSNLRTLILGSPFIDDISEIITKISKIFRNLRVLDVMSKGYKIVPRVVGDLKNLRFLCFWRSSTKELLDSVLQLYHLQFLILPSSIKTLPFKLSNLIKLRRIEMYDSDAKLVNTIPPVPYLGKLTSLQCWSEFHVIKEEGYELQQLGNLKEIGGSLRIVKLENVKDKEEAIQAKLIEKSKLKMLELVWDELAEINGIETEVIEALQPTTNLELLKIDGYKGSSYPTWLQEGSFIENIKGLMFYNCNALTILPQNFHQFRHCSRLILENLGALRELPTFPEHLTELSIIKCPYLILLCENEQQINEHQKINESGFLKFSILYSQDILVHELKSFKKMVSVENYGEQLQILESIVQNNALEHSININVNRAWWTCHQQRMNFIFRSDTPTNKLKLPTMLRVLHLDNCCVSDGALSDCLRVVATLQKLYLSCIMTITTLPPIHVLESLQSLQDVEIKNCWYLRSLGGLHALPHLERFWIDSCWCVEMYKRPAPMLPVKAGKKHLATSSLFAESIQNASNNTLAHFILRMTEIVQNASNSGFLRSYTQLPPTIKSLDITACSVPEAIFNGDFSCLQNVVINNCHVPPSLSFRQLTNLKSLVLMDCSHLFFIEGLKSRPFINTLQLLRLPNLSVESVRKSWQGCQQLVISSPVMLNNLLSTLDFAPAQYLEIRYCEEESISFEKSDHLQSIKTLVFNKCKTKNLPETLREFSNLKVIKFIDCLEISELPELPKSVQIITIRGCSVLRERCKPNNGPDWHKIQHIQDR